MSLGLNGNPDAGIARTISLFVSSPGDVLPEREAVTRVVQRINDEQRDLLKIRDIRWESAYFGATTRFRPRSSKREACELVVCIFWRRLGLGVAGGLP